MPGEVWRPFPAALANRPTKACAACQVPLLMVPGKPKASGKPSWIPLDLTTLRKRSGEVVDGSGDYEARSHFQTCPEPQRFSGRR